MFLGCASSAYILDLRCVVGMYLSTSATFEAWKDDTILYSCCISFSGHRLHTSWH